MNKNKVRYEICDDIPVKTLGFNSGVKVLLVKAIRLDISGSRLYRFYYVGFTIPTNCARRKTFYDWVNDYESKLEMSEDNFLRKYNQKNKDRKLNLMVLRGNRTESDGNTFERVLFILRVYYQSLLHPIVKRLLTYIWEY